MAEEAAWLRALLAAELDTAVGPQGLQSPAAIADALGQLLAQGTLVRAPDQPLLLLARDSDGARCVQGLAIRFPNWTRQQSFPALTLG